MPTTALLLVRHGQSTWNADGRWQGTSDPPLSELGERQALDAVAHLRSAGITAVVSSTLQRARRTAELLASGLGLGAVQLDERLVERSFGVFQGLTITEILERWADLFDETGKLQVTPPGGEEREAVVARVLDAVAAIARAHPGERVLAVAHGGVIRNLDHHVGADIPPTTPNLGGRWYEVDAESGAVTPGELLTPIEPDMVTAPTTE